MHVLEAFFWIAFIVVLYTYVGYGILVRIILFFKRFFSTSKKMRPFSEWPDVTLLICAYNEQSVVEMKMENCLSLDYPKDKLRIVWVTDGSNDKTNEMLSAYDDVTVYFKPERMGKTAALNRAVPFVETPYIVFTDANTILNKMAIKEIITPFVDEKVGCVSGEKRIIVQEKDGMAPKGEGAYWKYESLLKKWDGELYSAMGAAGELFAIRTSLFEPIDINMLLDDFIMSMKIVSRGYKIAYCDTAYACETGSASIVEEQKRKKRIAAGGLQSIWVLRGLMNPFKYGIVSFQLVSHRFLRWSLTPIALFSLIPINILLVYLRCGCIYDFALICQFVFYIMALLKIKIPYYFVFMNLNVISGFIYLVKKKKGSGAWEKAQRA